MATNERLVRDTDTEAMVDKLTHTMNCVLDMLYNAETKLVMAGNRIDALENADNRSYQHGIQMQRSVNALCDVLCDMTRPHSREAVRDAIDKARLPQSQHPNTAYTDKMMKDVFDLIGNEQRLRLKAQGQIQDAHNALCDVMQDVNTGSAVNSQHIGKLIQGARIPQHPPLGDPDTADLARQVPVLVNVLHQAEEKDGEQRAMDVHVRNDSGSNDSCGGSVVDALMGEIATQFDIECECGRLHDYDATQKEVQA